MIEAWLIPLLVLACLGFAFTCWLFWRRRRRYARQVAAMHRDVVESAEAAAFGKRISRRELPLELDDLGGTINKLFDALAAKDAQMRQREYLFQNLANTVPGIVLVHRERIIFSNDKGSEPMGLEPTLDLARLLRKTGDRRRAFAILESLRRRTPPSLRRRIRAGQLWIYPTPAALYRWLRGT